LKYELVCGKCKEEFGETEKVLVCRKCGGWLDVRYNSPKRLRKRNLLNRDFGLWRYLEYLPVLNSKNIVTLGEGGTKLVHCQRLGEKYGLKRLFLKDESKNPTFSFKDRLISVAVTKAIEAGVRVVATETTGNAGSSLSAYAAKSGLQCFVLVTADSSDAVVAKLVAYGGVVAKVKATDGEITELVVRACERFGWYNVITAWTYNPFVAEGGKTIGYEIAEQLGWEAPDWLVAPVGAGCCLSSTWKGFRHFHDLRLSHSLPRMIGAQAEGCAPLVNAIKKHLEPSQITKWKNPLTIAHSIADDLTIDADIVMSAISQSKGTGEVASDAEILKAQAELASLEGIFIEPASAATLAVTKKMSDAGSIDSSDTVVVIGTGSGLNMPESVFHHYGKPPELSSNFEELEKFIQSKAKAFDR
jgi:threonine synthase